MLGTKEPKIRIGNLEYDREIWIAYLANTHGGRPFNMFKTERANKMNDTFIRTHRAEIEAAVGSVTRAIFSL